ncbi:PleD family two-component system response regulator [Rhodobium gokarnense]|uniref:diguanylate cyclase n=1 Tax=Rhodobium gokarnense TaxID=364296 RepID=A0ABT3HA49_9HYPH|nr:PleD family two-component system response regulator [Rhodobium gokarnense]MCW2307270.1 two-component system cell cycle response regulator [Rhodobium gokarnense]
MTARVLVVDDIPANTKLLEARLTAEYFEVLTANNGPDALAACQADKCDIVLLDVMMPGMDGFEVCRRLKADPRTVHIPVVMVTALDQPADRVKGLEAGADDFLTKPVNDIALITRVKSLVRLKMLTDEWRMRSVTGRDIGFEDTAAADDFAAKGKGRILLVDDRRSSYERMAASLAKSHDVTVETDPQEALFRAAEGDFELVMISLALANFDGLRLCSQLRSLERTRMVPVLLITEPEDNARLLRGLDLGVNDYLVRPIDKNEMMARTRTQIRRKRYTDHLRDNVQQTMELAVTDALTGLHNRRYLESHLATLVSQAVQRSKTLAVLMVDLDYFKAVNDTYGHDAGDDVLREFARRLRKNLRGIDLACRFGGEEFVVVMPETDLSLAVAVAERIRQKVAGEPFLVNGGARALDVTISVGLAMLDHYDDTPQTILKRADEALYAAKRDGRNRVVADAA